MLRKSSSPSIIFIISAGGGFKQILIDSGVGTSIAQMSDHLFLSPIVLAFMVAGLIRIATGSATVALTTAAGIVSPIIQHMSGVNLELLVIAGRDFSCSHTLMMQVSG